MSNTESEQRHRITKALRFIQAHFDSTPDQELTVQAIAKAAHFSEFHFQRLFSAYMGESVFRYVQSRRMEKAAQLLLESKDARVLEVGQEVGFSSHSAFSRTFRQHFQVSPSTFRKQGCPPTLQSPPLLVHHPLQPPSSEGLFSSIQKLDDQYFFYQKSVGTIDGTFFIEHSEEPRAFFIELYREGFRHFISGFPNSPTRLDDPKAEIWFGVRTPEATPTPSAEHFQTTLPEGRWATFLHIGDHKHLFQTWNWIYRGWFPGSGQQLRDTMPFEQYISSPHDTPTTELQTKIYIPIQ